MRVLEYIEKGKFALKAPNPNNFENRQKATDMMKIKSYSTLLLALMGSMDCFTTVIGILYFGAVELNPFIAGVVSTNIPAFVVLKLITTVFVCLIFVQAEKILLKTQDKTTRTFKWTYRILKTAYIGVIAFMVIVVVNNLFVLISAL
jgi:hypothetical protein